MWQRVGRAGEEAKEPGRASMRANLHAAWVVYELHNLNLTANRLDRKVGALLCGLRCRRFSLFRRE